MAIEVVIYDMDGVLVDSEVYWTQSRREFALDRGKVWSDESQLMAMGRSTIGWATVMQEHLELSMSTDDIIVEMKKRVMDHYERHMPDRPGALQSVRTLAQHYRVALASGSPTEIIRHVMSLTGLDQVFEVIVYGDDVPNGKPAPDIYFEALKRLGITADKAIGIEDSGNGIRSLKAAGIRAIAAPSPEFPLSSELLALSDYHISSLEEMTPELIARLAQNES